MRTTVTRTIRAAAAGAIAASVLAACSSSGSTGNSSPAADSKAGPCGTTAKTTLTVGLFGTFGYKENGLYTAFQKACPNITIKEDDVEQSADYWTKLKTHLASGTGLDDVQGIEIGFVADVVANHSKQFVNFAKLSDSATLKSSFYDWKWQQASSADGTDTVGLGTDAGPEAICYRPDLLAKAGLPADPATLATKWKTWEDFIAFGKQYQAAAGKQAGSHFVDSAASIFSTAVYQGTEAYADAQGKADVANSDGVKTAWKYATDAATAGITAKLQQFSDPWNKAFSSGSFAALACPTWMMGYIQGQAGPAGSGHWNIAPVLPGGATNWGGSWLGVPTASKHQAAAVAFVKWATNATQQVTMWTAKAQGGHWPSNKLAAEQPGVRSATSAYFSNAPVGTLFGSIAASMKIPPIGLYDTPIQNAFTTELTNVETKGTKADSAFSSALDQIKQITG
ncbi:MAG TPA: extracellular solute-binding protein [Jatrophihabitans sp.]|jgi:cellobiose transport system substrate-binding protein|uniref:ABC transporter substrate-binding protein n=1 Tax=Jatrophihabitans sp. TaxID=1932789 RepID=UPI002DFB4E80|nr:extracellular solute-binding protein [Jatrophihabitans sp.]